MTEYDIEHEKRKKWFEDRIGKLVFEAHSTCPCGSCEYWRENGYTIPTKNIDMCIDELLMAEELTKNEPNPIRYFDTLGERDEFEKQYLNKPI